MMMLNLFIALTERDKRFLLILFLLIIVVIAFIAVCGALITRVMRWQGLRMDDLTHDVVVTDVIENKKQFYAYARLKNWRLFFLQSWKPLIVVVASIMVLILRNAITRDWSYDLVDYKTTGFTTLFFVFDFNDPSIYHTFFGITLICDWPKVVSAPHFSIEAWASYLFFFGLIVGGTWYLITVQCVISRTIRMYQLAQSMYHKSLEGYNKYDQYKNPANTNNPTGQVNNNNNNPNT